MHDDRVDLHLRPAQRVDPLDFSIRVDGLENVDHLERIRRGIGRSLRRGMFAGSDALAADDQRVEDKLDVSVSGRLTSSDRQRGLNQLLRVAVQDELGQLPSAARDFDMCVCAGAVPGDRINLTAAEINWFVDGVWTLPPNALPGEDFWVITVALDSAPFNWARLILRNGATFSPPVPRNQVLVGLANGTDWAKEIWSENLCSGRLGSVYQEGPSSTPRRMLLSMPVCREGTDTIVFRKPGFWGIWHDVGHFPPEVFWQAFGGTVADFTWVID